LKQYKSEEEYLTKWIN